MFHLIFVKRIEARVFKNNKRVCLIIEPFILVELLQRFVILDRYFFKNLQIMLIKVCPAFFVIQDSHWFLKDCLAV